MTLPRAFLAALLVLTPLAVEAQPTDETRAVALDAFGGIAFETPAWEEARKTDGVAVLRRSPDRSKSVSFAVLVLTIEEGPAELETVDWERIRDNVVSSAGAKGTRVTLTLGEAWSRTAGVTGRRLSGTLEAKERTVRLEMVALVRPGALITVSGLGPADSDEPVQLVEAVAATAKQAAAP